MAHVTEDALGNITLVLSNKEAIILQTAILIAIESKGEGSDEIVAINLALGHILKLYKMESE